jgi:thioredoxin-related protein
MPRSHREVKVIRFAVVVLAVLLTLPLFAQAKLSGAGTPPKRQLFDPQRDADKDIREAIEKATTSGQRILLDVGGEWCVWCRRLDSFIATHPKLQGYLKNQFVVVKVNYSKENRNENVLSRYPAIPGYPHFFVLDADGTFLHSQETGVLEAGRGYSEEKLLDFLTQWAPQGASK